MGSTEDEEADSGLVPLEQELDGEPPLPEAEVVADSDAAVAGDDPGDPDLAPAPPPDGARPSRGRLARKNHELRAQRRRLRLGIGALAAFSLVVVAWLWLRAAGSAELAGEAALRASQLEAQLAEARGEAERARSELETLRGESAALVEQRIPNLRLLELDRVLPIESGVVRNVRFTLLQSETGRSYEHSLVLENKSSESVRPRVDVVLFDRLGVEIGRSRVGIVDADAEGGAGELSRYRGLRPAEVRSHSGRIVVRGETPRYFLVVTR